jgi:DNA-binding NarL/FixJ family response regulator
LAVQVELPETKIVVMSQHDPHQIRERVVEAGGDACLDKSLLATEFIAAIKKLMSSGSPESDA